MGTNPLSAFEQEFELDNNPANAIAADEYSYEYADDEFEGEHEQCGPGCNCRKGQAEMESAFGDDAEMDDEFEADEETGDDEFESDEEFEADEEYDADNESDDEFEAFEETDYAGYSRDGIYDRDREFEHRIYNAMINHRDNELGLEMELDVVLHEMERDYFFGAAKKWLKKKGLRTLKKFAKNLPITGALKAVSSLARGDIRSLLKNKLLQAAAGFIPVAGPLVSKAMGIAGSLSGAASDAKSKIKEAIQIGKDAYQDLAESVPEAQNEFEVRRYARTALRNAVARNTVAGNRKNKTKSTVAVPPNASVTVYTDKVSVNRGQKIIALKPGSAVNVKPGKIIIWQTR